MTTANHAQLDVAGPTRAGARGGQAQTNAYVAIAVTGLGHCRTAPRPHTSAAACAPSTWGVVRLLTEVRMGSASSSDDSGARRPARSVILDQIVKWRPARRAGR